MGREPRTDVAQLWQEFKRDMGNHALRNRLMEIYLPLVKYQALRLWTRLPDEIELDDIVSAGVFGLLDALEAFDLSRGIKFETYCVLRIRGAMLDELRQLDWVPRLVRSKASRLKEAIATLEARLGRPPSQVEIARALGITTAELERMAADAYAVNLLSLNEKVYQTDRDEKVRRIDLLVDPRGEDPTRRARLADVMRLVCTGLSRRERLIVVLYYYEGLTMLDRGRPEFNTRS